MGDIADMLGVEKIEGTDPVAAALGMTKKPTEKKASKPLGMSREVYNLIGQRGYPPLMPTSNNSEDTGKSNEIPVKWEWVEFRNSARTDNATFRHWIKAGSEQSDYTFAKYNVRTPVIDFTFDEYQNALEDKQWTEKETRDLLYLCAKYDMSWPVIYDRFESSKHHPIENVQERFYSVAEKLKLYRMRTRNHIDGTSNEPIVINGAYGSEEFDFEYEQTRRKQLELIFGKDASAEQQEEDIREELRELDLKIKKIKQKKKNDDGEKVAAEINSLRQLSSTMTKGITKIRVTGSNPVGRPYLQSSRLTDATQVPINQVQTIISELGVPDNLMATQALCDLNDALKKDIVTLLTLQKVASKMENELNFVQEQIKNPMTPVSNISLDSFSTSATRESGKRVNLQGSSKKGKKIRR